jgi:polyhydroxyalkanoate synthesis regulator protein
MEIIKRYKNRHLYSTTLSKYISLDYILDLVKSNQKFQVIETGSKKDVTSDIIRQSMIKLDLNKSDMIVLIKGK